MLKHEEFDELCALAATGQLSVEDERELSEHLKSCEPCRELCEDLSVIFREMPIAERGIIDKEIVRRVEESGLRDRFLARARAEGHRFSEEAEKTPAKQGWKLPWLQPVYPRLALGLVAVALVATIGYRWPHHNSESTAGAAAPTKSASTSAADDLAKRVAELQQANDSSHKTTDELKAENARLVSRLDALEKELATTASDKESLGQTLAQTNALNTALSSEVDKSAQLLAETKSELEKAQDDRGAMVADLAAAKNQVSDLSDQVRLEQVSLDQDRQLLFAGRDITDLMGARNLHIIDVHDADGGGKDRRPFGRVFYTEGKSLIFYAFDLDDRKLANSKYEFAAWGERLGQPQSVKSLGLVYSDDKALRRWVLKVDDPHQLQEIDSVFVTLEPHDGPTDKPRGQKILYAFLGGQANHP